MTCMRAVKAVSGRRKPEDRGLLSGAWTGFSGGPGTKIGSLRSCQLRLTYLSKDSRTNQNRADRGTLSAFTTPQALRRHTALIVQQSLYVVLSTERSQRS